MNKLIHAYLIGKVARKVGGFRCFVFCSYAYAIEMSSGSLLAALKKEIPTGRLETWPIGTVILGNPAIAADP